MNPTLPKLWMIKSFENHIYATFFYLIAKQYKNTNFTHSFLPPKFIEL